MARRSRDGLLLAASAMALGCGGGAAGGGPAEDPAAAEASGARSSGPTGTEGMSASAETGALSKQDVQAAFQAAMPKVQRCLASGRKRVPHLGGDIEVYLQINSVGKASTSVLTTSTLGDHQAEGCILDAFRAQQWPRPVGGKVGESTQSFSFSPDPDEEPAKDWSSEDLASAMNAEDGDEPAPTGPAPYDELTGKLDRCRRDAGASRLSITIYLDDDGMMQGVGLAGPEPGARATADCVQTVIQTTSFPSPGNHYVKVTVSVP